MKEYEVVFEVEGEGLLSFSFSSNSSCDVIEERAKSLIIEDIGNKHKENRRFRIVSIKEILGN